MFYARLIKYVNVVNVNPFYEGFHSNQSSIVSNSLSYLCKVKMFTIYDIVCNENTK